MGYTKVKFFDLNEKITIDLVYFSTTIITYDLEICIYYLLCITMYLGQFVYGRRIKGWEGKCLSRIKLYK